MHVAGKTRYISFICKQCYSRTLTHIKIGDEWKSIKQRRHTQTKTQLTQGLNGMKGEIIAPGLIKTEVHNTAKQSILKS